MLLAFYSKMLENLGIMTHKFYNNESKIGLKIELLSSPTFLAHLLSGRRLKKEFKHFFQTSLLLFALPSPFSIITISFQSNKTHEKWWIVLVRRIKV